MNFSNRISSYSVFNIYTVAFFISILFCSCGTSKIDSSANFQINFLDEYIYESGKSLQGNIIGGLSGIDYDGTNFVLISDKSKAPEIYVTEIQIENSSIKSIKFKSVEKLNCNYIEAFDTESIRFLPNKSGYLVTTEGNINAGKSPQIIEVNARGECQKSYDLPQHFKLEQPNKPRQNAVFEGSTLDFNKKGFWTVNEIPLEDDGKKPKLINTNSPVRLTHYQLDGQNPDFQVSYDLERLIRIPLLPFGINGVTEILQIDQTQMLVLERSYSAGHKSKGNRVKLFLINITNAENTLELDSLKKQKNLNLEKLLLFDSKKIRKQLEFRFIDNIEGISFGPELPNGNKSLILVSDNNFNKLGQQINQFILLELINTNTL
jgi:hypothetical protein